MTEQDAAKSDPGMDIESIFQMGGGRFADRLHRLNLAKEGRLHSARVTLLLTAAAWLPLLVLAAIDGVALGNRVEVPFLPSVFLVMPAQEVLETVGKLLA